MSRPDKAELLARNAALRAELARELANVRIAAEPVLHWVDRARTAGGWAHEHAPLLSAAAALGGMLLLRRRARTAPPSGRAASHRLERLRLALAVGAAVWRLVRQLPAPGPRGEPPRPHSPR